MRVQRREAGVRTVMSGESTVMSGEHNREYKDEGTETRVRSLEPTSVESTRVEGTEVRVKSRERPGSRAMSTEYRVDGTESRAQSRAQCESTLASTVPKHTVPERIIESTPAITVESSAP